MDLIPAGFGDQVYRAAGIASRLRASLGLRGEFFNRVNRHYRTGDSRDTALIDRGDVVPEVIIVHAVDLPIDLIGSGSIERPETAYVITPEARRDGYQLGEVPPVQWHVLDEIGGDRHRLRLGSGVERQRRGGNFHRRGLLLQCKPNRQGINRTRNHLDLVHGISREARGRNSDLIEAERNVLEGKGSFTRRDGVVVDPRGAFRGFHRCIRYHCSRRIRYCSVDGAAERLGVCCYCERENNENCKD